MADPSGVMQTVEWRCLKCRNIPWNCEEWELHPVNAILEQDLMLHLDHHESSAALEESAADGCCLCRNFRARILHYLSELSELPTGKGKLWFFRGNDIHFQIGDDSHHEIFEALTRSKSATWLPEWDGTPGPSPWPKSFSPETADQDLRCLVRDSIEPWLNNCINGNRMHRKCKHKYQMDEMGAMPTRLIDVGDARDATARLVVSHEVFQGIDLSTQPIKYLILSYCWGQGNDPAKTTRANIDARRKRITTADLPKTIQDAITLTRLLGFRYLWVDALCIIQSHKGDNFQDDFKAEAPKMGAYYTNAVCLISALGAPDSSTGLFAPRPAHRYPTTSCVIGFDRRTNEYLHLPMPRRTLADEFDAAPLLKRGWCFQERLLARRILHWSRNGLFWKCVGDSLIKSEFSRRSDDFISDARISNSCVFHGIFAPGPNMGQPWDPWMHFVHEYSSKAFSFPKDRLIAVHGLGTRLVAFRGDEYFGGVFGGHISWGLIWQCDAEDETREKLDCFPSWSWASCQSNLGVIIADESKPSFECATFGGFPPVQDPLDFQGAEKRMLRVNAPLLLFEPGQYRKNNDISYDFEVQGAEFNAFFNYDTVKLEPAIQGRLHILLLLLGNVQKGIILCPKEGRYERVGYTSLYYMSGPKGFKELSFWERFRVGVEII